MAATIIVAAILMTVAAYLVCECCARAARRPRPYRPPVWESDEPLPPAPRHGMPVRKPSAKKD